MLPPDEATKTRQQARLKAWCLICFSLGLLLTNYPLLQIFNSQVTVAGVPLMVAYLLVMWVAAILVLFILAKALGKLAEKEQGEGSGPSPQPSPRQRGEGVKGFPDGNQLS
ncbi:MAG: hypothetical protein ACUVRZ_08145 [Desulfobacca sp.]|uniref:hypothetical protein n=1 Tax=Desulfobacca sp. TaxID=2067990 RepID=UPI00404900D1